MEIINIFNMSYTHTPSRLENNLAKKAVSPTTAHSRDAMSQHSSSGLFRNVLSSIDGIIL